MTDLSPLKALPRLQRLVCQASPNSGSWLSDLAPLRGLPLTELHCNWTQVADLTPLKGMPLGLLHCHYARVSDLSPLAGMPLKDLLFDYTQVEDLAVLRGIETLETINFKLAAEFWRQVDAQPAAAEEK